MGSGKGVRLEPGHVDRGLLGVQWRPSVDAPLPPPVGPGGPPLWVGDVVVLLPRPALVRPPLAALVAAALGEAQEGRVGDRGAADAEARQVDQVARALVVEREAVIVGAHRELARRDLDRVEARAGRRAPRRGRRLEPGRGAQAGELDRLQHRLRVLELVLEHHLVDVGGAEAVEDRERSLAHLGQVVERLGAVEQRQVAAHGARRLERVVHRGQLGVQQRLTAVAVDEPQVLVGGDVGEIPDERAHQRRVRGLDVRVGERRDQLERPPARVDRARRRSGWRRARTRRSRTLGTSPLRAARLAPHVDHLSHRRGAVGDPRVQRAEAELEAAGLPLHRARSPARGSGGPSCRPARCRRARSPSRSCGARVGSLRGCRSGSVARFLHARSRAADGLQDGIRRRADGARRSRRGRSAPR